MSRRRYYIRSRINVQAQSATDNILHAFWRGRTIGIETEMILVLFFLGLVVGSFLNVLIDRLATDESVVYPPSHCDFCKKKLLWYDLVPVFSFLALQGRCRFCHSPISWQYPIVEFITGSVFAATPLFLQQNFQLPITDFRILITFAVYLFFTSSLIVIFFTDLKYGIIPNTIVYSGIVVSLLHHLITNYQVLITNYFLSALGAFLFFLVIYLLTKGRGMGFGDVKLSFLLGLFFGYPNIVFVLYIAFLTGAIFSIILIITRKKKLKETIVFGPFLVLASFLVLFFYTYLQNLWILPN